MLDKILRFFVADQIKALLEKLETQEFDTRSLDRIRSVLSDLDLTRLERRVVLRAYKRVRHLHDMNRIMEEIIIGQGEYNINMDINEKLQTAIDNATRTGPQGKRVVVRPRATTP
jgi:hypothetical protein